MADPFVLVPPELVYEIYFYLDPVDAWHFSEACLFMKLVWNQIPHCRFSECHEDILQRQAWSYLRWMLQQTPMEVVISSHQILQTLLRRLFTHCDDTFFMLMETCSFSQPFLATTLAYCDLDITRNEVAARLLETCNHKQLWGAFVRDAVTTENIAQLNLLDRHITFRIDLIESMFNACKYGCLRSLAWIYDKGVKRGLIIEGDTHLPMDMAMQHGHILVLEWLRTRFPGLKPSKSGVMHAVMMGKLETIQWLYRNNLCDDLWFCSQEYMSNASRNTQYEILKWFIEEVGAKIHVETIVNVSQAGNIDMVNYLLDRYDGAKTDKRAMNYAAQEGHLDMVRLLHERGWGCTRQAMDSAAGEGHLDVVVWLHENRTEGCSTQAMDSAAMCGHMDMVLWLHENRNEGCTSSAMDHAASNGYLHIVTWLHENRHEGCTEDAMDYAASNCKLDVMAWLWQNRHEGCTSRALSYAAEASASEIVKWLIVNKPWAIESEEISDAFMISAMAGDLLALEWIHATQELSSTNIEEAFWAATTCSNLRVADWLYSKVERFENREEARGAYRTLIAREHTHILAYLLKKGLGTLMQHE